MRGWELVSCIANEYDVSTNNVILGCGSAETISMLIHALASPGDEIIYPWPSFSAKAYGLAGLRVGY